jgi:hypothetical protein
MSFIEVSEQWDIEDILDANEMLDVSIDVDAQQRVPQSMAPNVLRNRSR